MMSYDSTPDTLWHSLRVAELIKELLDRSVRHDLSKTREPERAVYDEFVPHLRAAAYGSVEYRSLVDAMGEGLRHHAKNSRVLPVITRLPDGSWLSRLGGIEVRVIDAEITATLGGRKQHTGR